MRTNDITILIADDDVEIAGIIERILQSEGYKIVKAYDGREAYGSFTNSVISLAIIDIMMPQLSGIELISLIRERCNIPILVLSARTEEADRVMGLTVGAVFWAALVLVACIMSGLFLKSPVRVYFEWSVLLALLGASAFIQGSPYQRLNRILEADWLIIVEPVIFACLLVIGIQGAVRALKVGLLTESLIGRSFGKAISEFV